MKLLVIALLVGVAAAGVRHPFSQESIDRINSVQSSWTVTYAQC